MIQNLEPGIRELVEEFQSNGKPCPSKQTIAERRAGYLNSTVLAGKSAIPEREFLDVVMAFRSKFISQLMKITYRSRFIFMVVASSVVALKRITLS